MQSPLLLRAQVYAKRSKFLKFGLPFITFMVLGSFGLSEFTEVRVSWSTLTSCFTLSLSVRRY